MLTPNRRCLGGFVFAVALFPAGARAQAAADSFEELQRMSKVRQTVMVIDESGREVKGRVDQLATASITVGGRTPTGRNPGSFVERDPDWCGHRDGARNVGLPDRSERTWKRRDIYRRYRSRGRDRRRH